MLSAWQSENCRIYFQWYIFVILGASGVFGASEYSVYKAITTDYDKNVRPVHNISTVTIVSVDLTYFVLTSMDQIQETVTFLTDLKMTWKDELARWNTSEFDDISSVRIPANLLWKPDIILPSGLRFDHLMPDDQRLVSVFSDGTVQSSSPCMITNRCLLSVAAFPYDVQTCRVTMGSWMYPNTQVDLIATHKYRNPDSAAIDYPFQGNGEWTLLSFDTNVVYTYEDGLRYTQLTYTIRLKRQPIYYICVLLIPTFLTATICLLGLFLPAMNTGERIEKVNMGLATLLSMAILLGIVAGEMPKTTTLPLLGFYVLSELLLCTIGVGVSMLIMVAHQRVSTRLLTPPRWINTIVLFKMKTIEKPEKTNVTTAFTEKTFRLLSKDEKMTDQFENTKILKRLDEVLDNVKKYIEDKTFEDQLFLQWIIIFDRIDTFFLVLFNLVNLLMSGILLF